MCGPRTPESDWASNLQVSVDYFDYEITDVISSLASSSIIGRCFNQLGANPTFDPNNEFCQLFGRNANNFGIQGVQTTTLNLAALGLTGIDLSVDWKIPLGEDGNQLGFKLLATNTIEVEQQETSTDPFFSRKGTIGQTVASAFPEWKAVLATSFSMKQFLFRYNLRWIDAMRAVNNDAILSTPTVGLKPHVPNYFYHDITARWTPERYVGSAARHQQHRRQGAADLHDGRAGGYSVEYRSEHVRRAGPPRVPDGGNEVLTTAI